MFKNDLLSKIGLCQFLGIKIIYLNEKNQTKLINHSWEKCQTDGQRDGQNI